LDPSPTTPGSHAISGEIERIPGAEDAAVHIEPGG